MNKLSSALSALVPFRDFSFSVKQENVIYALYYARLTSDNQIVVLCKLVHSYSAFNWGLYAWLKS